MSASIHEPTTGAIVVDPEIMGGEPVFRGTRVPVASLFEHLESGCSLDEFLDWFPTVTQQVAVEVLMEAHRRVVQS
ncbi:MAG: DUF433 domain-containing protein [Prosthecobacter sp.]|uniref:DUF433 domain-containing protein n=1 Tax=Prosthecobacter sp. TaxID=1965333 RepID=UPI0038FF129D